MAAARASASPSRSTRSSTRSRSCAPTARRGYGYIGVSTQTALSAARREARPAGRAGRAGRRGRRRRPGRQGRPQGRRQGDALPGDAGQARRRRDRRGQRQEGHARPTTSARRSPGCGPGDTVTLDVYRDGDKRDGRGEARRAAVGTARQASQPLSELVVELALGLREHVLPQLGLARRACARAGRRRRRRHVRDRRAGRVVPRAVPRASARRDVAFYSEDRGLVEPSGQTAVAGAGRRSDRRHAAGDGGLRGLLRVGRRGAARRRGSPTMGDVEIGCIVEIKSGTLVPGRARCRRRDPRARRDGARRRASAPTPTSRGCSGRSASAAGRRCR